MKFDELRSIAHNIAGSLASGIGLLIGVYEMDLFGEAGQSREGFVEVDFLNGTASGGRPSPSLARAIALNGEAFPSFCEKHGISRSAFRQVSARYSADELLKRFVVTVEDREGHRSSDEYIGSPGRRVRLLDPLGRIRLKRGFRVRTEEGGDVS